MPSNIVIMWFRQDLRLSDNPALLAASQQGKIVAVYILDKASEWSRGKASNWWLHHSLSALNKSLNGNLWILSGDPTKLLPDFAKQHSASHIYWNRCYEPSTLHSDNKTKEKLSGAGLVVKNFNSSLLWEPWENLKQDGTPYKIFTPFYKHAMSSNLLATPSKAPTPTVKYIACKQKPDRIDSLTLLSKTHSYEDIPSTWTPGEQGAKQRLQKFIDNGLSDYRNGRDYPAKCHISMLSPHLHFGEISPTEAVQTVKQAGILNADESQAEHFIRELAWREFSYYTLYHFPHLCQQNMRSQFDHFPWVKDEKNLICWQQGETGFPLIDAGMRELRQTGYMHNRVRMVVASFLVKNLMIHWMEGARWFWNCLVDADLANNNFNWQWVAGSGADTSPYFRIFNPITQSKKFDPEGIYIRRYVPELRNLSNKAIHAPSIANPNELQKAGIELGRNYPREIVDLSTSRAQALEAYKSLPSAAK
jgi:deoxyribodipyrimidine photo-lyase